jgi:hypothetical protein
LEQVVLVLLAEQEELMVPTRYFLQSLQLVEVAVVVVALTITVRQVVLVVVLV